MSGIAALIYKDRQKKVTDRDLIGLIDPIRYPDKGDVKHIAKDHVGMVVYDQFSDSADHFIYENDQILVVCDTEIYNYRELFPDIKGIEFSEAEIIARLYSKHGQDWWKNVNGPFGVFIWDKTKQEGFAYTDRIGIRPLVYFQNAEKVIVASRIRSISSLPGFNKELEKQAIFSYILMEMIPTPYTIFRDIRKLESGHFLYIQNGSLEPRMYWSMQYPVEKITGQQEIEEKVYDLTKSAVERMVNYKSSVKEVGAFLSGGTDSSTIAGLINELYPGEARTFSIGFDEPGYDEMHYARIAAREFQTQHTEYYITPDDILNSLPEIVAAYDEPFANSSVIPAYFCAKLAKEKGLRVMLGGDGGDEIFGGNARYHQHFADFQRYPKWLMNSLWPFLKKLPEWSRFSLLDKAYRHIRRARAPLHQRIHAYNLLHYLKMEDIFHPDFLADGPFELPEDISGKYIVQSGTADILDQYLYNDLKLTLMDNDLRKVNRMTELAHMQVRYPFLDISLLELTGTIPADLKVRDGQLRYIFKESFKSLLPAEIIAKTKHGFGLPVVPWMMRWEKLNNYIRRIIFDNKNFHQHIFNTNFINNLYTFSQKDTTKFYGSFLYYCLFLKLWLQENFEKSYKIH
ncbi:MAG: asparagine synthase (glutamine-hydrolyzing) [Calditrichaeota bacterium]|nr:asparagine synthase (glutamine-hydrolyzing) [Calditrichota bacterium]